MGLRKGRCAPPLRRLGCFVATNEAVAPADRTQVAVAGRLKPGDRVVVDGQTKVIAAVKRAAGRKPPQGENLHVSTEDGEMIRVNSTAGVRIPRVG